MHPAWLIIIAPLCSAAGFIAHALCAAAKEGEDPCPPEKTSPDR